jgi:cell division protein FtsZ
LHATADAVICFENDVMGGVVSPKAGIDQAFAAANQTISQCVRAISDMFTQPGILHIGFDDLCAALRPGAGAGRCLFGYGEADGDNRAHEALNRALRNPLMDRGRMLEEAHNVLVNVAGGPDMSLNEVQLLMEAFGKHIGAETQILFGATVDPEMAGRMGVTIISSSGIGIAAETAPAFVPRVMPAPVKTTPLVVPSREPAPEEEVAAVEESPVEVEEIVAAPAAVEDQEMVAAAAGDVTDSVEQGSLLELAPKIEPPAPQMSPVRPRVPRSPRVPRIVTTATDPQPAPAAAKREEKQATLQFDSLTRGRFEKSEPTIVDGQDLDVPTFLRRNMRVS